MRSWGHLLLALQVVALTVAFFAPERFWIAIGIAFAVFVPQVLLYRHEERKD